MFDVYYPKNKITRGSRVVIYGAGETGKAFQSQIREDEYCTIVAFVDRNYGYINDSTSVFNPEWLIENTKEYDKLIIAALDWNTIIEIRDYLRSVLGISNERIVDCGYIWKHYSTGLEYELDDYDRLYSLIKQEEDIRFGVSIVMIESYIRTNACVCDKFISDVESLYYNCKKIKTKYLCAYILFVTDNDSKKLLVDFLGVIEKTSMHNVEWIIKMVYEIIPYRLMRRPEFIFDDYYIKMHNLSRILADYIYTFPLRKIKKLETRKRIAFSFSELYGENYHMLNWVIHKSDWLLKNGYNVAIFVEGKTYSNDEFFLGDDRKDIYSKYYEENRKLLDERVVLQYAEGVTLIEKMNNHLKNILRYDADCVFILNVNCSCIPEGLFGAVPTVLVPTTFYGSYNTGNCLAFYDKEGYLKQNSRWMKYISGYPSIYETIPGLIPFTQKKFYNRTELGYNSDDFILVTVGNRLSYELKSDFVDEICKLLTINKNARWVLIGTERIEYIEKNYTDLLNQHRITFIKYEEDLVAFFKICDVYVNPNRKGGGTSVLWAIQANIPVMMCEYDSDGQSYIGRDRVVKGNYEKLIEIIKKMCEDKAYYKLIKDSFIYRKKELEMEEKNNNVFFGSIEVANKDFNRYIEN